MTPKERSWCSVVEPAPNPLMILIAPPARDAQRTGVKLYAADAERRKLAAAQPRVERVPRRPRPERRSASCGVVPAPGSPPSLVQPPNAGRLATELASWSTPARDWRALWRTLLAPDGTSERRKPGMRGS